MAGMTSFTLNPSQVHLIERPLDRKIFLEGPAGSGKTTVGVLRVLRLLEAGVPAPSILLLLPQRTLASPYQEALRNPALPPGGQVLPVTVGGLARRMVDLFWPVLAEEAGFAHPDQPPSFLTLETALYYMAYLVHPLFEGGLFDSVTIDRNRIYSQIIDNLNKSAIVGFPHTEIGERLRESWIDNSAQANVFADAQRCANLFREYCLQNNLLDFSLQMELFNRFLWPSPLCRDYLRQTHRHLVVDNLEEDTASAHDLLRAWLPDFDSALLIYDQDAGFRRFLGADPEGAASLVEGCHEHHIFSGSLVTSPDLLNFSAHLRLVMDRDSTDRNSYSAAPLQPGTEAQPAGDMPPAENNLRTNWRLSSDRLLHILDFPERPLRFYPQMLDWVMARVVGLLQAGVPPREIVLLAPFLPDSLRFALANRLEARGIPYRSHRPSRSLREEPPAQALLTLAALAHPHWGLRPSRFEVAYALIQSIDTLDLVRAQLLVEAVYTTRQGLPSLEPFERVKASTRERITYGVGNRYEILRHWLAGYAAEPADLAGPPPDSLETELDFFFSRLFGEVLSQPGFGFHTNLDAGQVCANLIESAQKFRWAVQGRLPADKAAASSTNAAASLDYQDLGAAAPLAGDSLAQEYVHMIQEGILAAQYIQSWQIPPEDGVLLAPAYTFLLANQPVDHQFWLDVGSDNWSSRLVQPLTHPIVLSRRWQRDRKTHAAWTDVDEYEFSRDSLYRLALGLVRRCRSQIHLGLCAINEGGYESRGMLLRIFNQIMQQSRNSIPRNSIPRPGGAGGNPS